MGGGAEVTAGVDEADVAECGSDLSWTEADLVVRRDLSGAGVGDFGDFYGKFTPFGKS